MALEARPLNATLFWIIFMALEIKEKYKQDQGKAARSAELYIKKLSCIKKGENTLIFSTSAWKTDLFVLTVANFTSQRLILDFAQPFLAGLLSAPLLHSGSIALLLSA